MEHGWANELWMLFDTFMCSVHQYKLFISNAHTKALGGTILELSVLWTELTP